MTITIDPILPQPANTPFLVTGHYDSGASGLQYADGNGPFSALPLNPGARQTVVEWHFTHPGAAAGTLTIIIKMPGTSQTAQTSVIINSVTGGPSPDRTVVLAGSSSFITDSLLNKWGINVAGKITRNGLVDPITSAVTELAYVNKVVWQQNINKLWWHWDNGAWGPLGGTTLSPLGGIPPTPVPTPIITIFTKDFSHPPFA